MKHSFYSNASRIVFGLSLCLSGSAFANDLISIYQQAADNDHTFKAAVAGSKATAEDNNIGRAGLLPTITGTATWSDASTTSVNNTPTDEDETQSGAEVLSDQENQGYRINLTQPLFNMAAWYDYKAGRTSLDLANAELKTAEQSLIIRVAQAYFEALEASDNLETSKAEEEALKQQLEQSRQRFEVGLSAITEVHESQAAYDSAVASRITAEGNLGIAFEALEVLTGKTYNALAPIKEGFEAVPPSPKERKEWVNRALENNPDLATALANSKSLEHTAKSATADHLPTVTLEGSYSDSNSVNVGAAAPALGILNPTENDIDSEQTTITVTLNVPIFSGGSTSASRRQAKQQAIQARQNYLQIKRDTIQSARSDHLSVITSMATVKALKQAIVSNQSALEATQAGYSVGTRDLVDVLNAQQGLYQAKRNYFEALYTYILNTLQLKETAGILSENDLVQLNTWLDANKLVNKTTVSY